MSIPVIKVFVSCNDGFLKSIIVAKNGDKVSKQQSRVYSIDSKYEYRQMLKLLRSSVQKLNKDRLSNYSIVIGVTNKRVYETLLKGSLPNDSKSVVKEEINAVWSLSPHCSSLSFVFVKA